MGANAPAPRLTERQFQAQVTALAQLYGWKIFHPYLSLKSARGFPDLVLAKAGQPVLFAELKTALGRLTPAQQAWLEVLDDAQGCEVHLWRPPDWEAIERRLREGRTP